MGRPKKPREPKLTKTELSKPTPWEGIPEEGVEGKAGFVYLIVNKITQQKYIGRKYFQAQLKVKVAGKVRKKRKVKDSGWRHYKSSCTKLKQEIEEMGLDKFTFTILSLHDTRAKVNYAEVREQFVRDVLHATLPGGEVEYYNDCILSRYFRPTKKED